jgi:electron transfer flavoprotein beta subunit
MRTPLVVACLRVCDLRPEVDPLTGSIRRDVWGLGLSAADAAALEHALRIAEAWSGRVLAVAVGPATIEPVLREVSALGVSVVRIPGADDGSEQAYGLERGGDEQDLARAIVAALGPWGPPSVVLCGDRSADRGTGALPSFVAHELGAAQALGLVSLGVGVGRDGAPVLVAERRLDRGWREQLRVPLPAVCSVEGAGVRLRRASLAGALVAEASAIPLAPPSPPASHGSEATRSQVRVGKSRAYQPRTRVLPPPEGEDPRIRLLALTGALVAHDPPTVVGPVGAGAAADELIGFLVRHGYLDQVPEAGEGPVRVGSEDGR